MTYPVFLYLRLYNRLKYKDYIIGLHFYCYRQMGLITDASMTAKNINLYSWHDILNL